MCLEFLRGSTPHHAGGDSIVKRITRRYYSKALTTVPPGESYSGTDDNTPCFDSNGLIQNDGVITWTSVMADRQALNLESLLTMTPIVNGVDLVGRGARQLFLSHVKSQPNVRDTFFPSHERDRYESNIDPAWFDFEAFANIYVCQSIYQNKDEYNICKMVDGMKIEDMLADFYRSPDWKKIGFALYTLLFKDLVIDRDNMIPFSAYLENDRRYWASKLCERMHDSQWLHSVTQPVTQGKSTHSQCSQEMNILFVKLHLLDPTTVFQAHAQLKKALPALNLELVTTNYLGGPLEWKLIRADVQAAIKKPTLPKNASKLSMEEVDVYYGIPVIEFIMLEPKRMGLWSGRYADNKRPARVRDRCTIM